ncbi:hypothetical protein HIM_09330 [Hirsutella minnesotensis 3608]|uniref:Uncharacterized protein n=1 Tax=Hirsutella minnesotensis 3608 TaxID=1043627 RepID=A0A0F7ZXT0_9HYPO|nr:hypothetical protein HIM_09330 [Hirsutella minnesotensis 3608]
MTIIALPPGDAQTRVSNALFDPEPHYGDGDENALYNLFATWPENYFSSLPKPHGNRGIDEPYWELRQSQIFLEDCFRGRGTRRLSTLAIPGPDKLERARLREQVNSGGADDYIGRTVRFESALDFAQEQAKFDTQLALELAKHCQRRRVPSDNLDSSLWPLSPSPPPPLSQGQEKYE